MTAASVAGAPAPAGTRRPVIEIHKVTKVYSTGESQVHALRGVTCSIPGT